MAVPPVFSERVVQVILSASALALGTIYRSKGNVIQDLSLEKVREVLHWATEEKRTKYDFGPREKEDFEKLQNSLLRSWDEHVKENLP